MGACCTRNDALPECKAMRNTEESPYNIEDINKRLIDTSDTKESECEGMTKIELNCATIIAYILSPEIRTFDLIDIWKKVDVDNTNEINIEKGLEDIFLIFIDRYIEQTICQKTKHTLYIEKAQLISKELSNEFKTILLNYEYNNDDIITREFFLNNLQKYLSEPNPIIITSNNNNSEEEEEEEEEEKEEQFEETEEEEEEEEERETFDMLSYISTSPTINNSNTSNIDRLNEIVLKLESAMKISKKIQKGEEIGLILSSLTTFERMSIRHKYFNITNESLIELLENNFSGDLLLILLELCKSCEINDIEWIEKSRNKLNINTSVINEILMSRTNSQLEIIKKEYFKKYGCNLLDNLLKSFNSDSSYASLLKLILTDNKKVLRKEFNPQHLKYKKIKDDCKILYHILENTNKLNKLKIIEMLCHRSWYHIQILSNEYGKKSKYDLKTMIEKKFGKNSKSGDALKKIIDISRNKHLFFAQLLFQSMKGISVNHSQLIRIIVGRSTVDLGEISYIFTQKYGNGKTLLQWLKSNITKGTCRDVLLNILNNNTIDDTIDNKNQNQNHDTPTIYALNNFNSNLIAKELISVMTNKKKGKSKSKSKKLLIQTLTIISNKQRQELKNSFIDNHPLSIELSKATQETLRKGKTMIVMLGLLQRPSEFNCFWIKQSIKSKKIELFVELLCSLTNYEIIKMKEYYKKSSNTNSELINDCMVIVNGKNTAKYLILKILEGKRPETIQSDKKLCKIHLTEMNKLLKQKNQKACKQFFSKLFVENSYSQIKYEINKFNNNSSEHTLTSVVKKIMGNGISGIIIENIIQIATNKCEYFARKLRESMKGITTSEQHIIRILIGRSEKDLGDIIQYFNENIDIGEGKTFKQWIKNTLKGSFRTSLLRIADCCSNYDNNNNENENENSIEDYESQTESDILSSHLHSSKSNNILPGVALKRHATSPMPSSPKIITPTKIVVSSPEQVEKEINDIYDPYNVNEKEFGLFILEKVNEKTAQRLMQHLKQGNNNTNDNDDTIKSSQCIHVLLFACVLFLKYKEKTEKKPEIQIDKKLLKKSLMPSFNWMMENKLQNNATLKKSQYKRLGTWLQEYYKIKL